MYVRYYPALEVSGADVYCVRSHPNKPQQSYTKSIYSNECPAIQNNNNMNNMSDTNMSKENPQYSNIFMYTIHTHHNQQRNKKKRTLSFLTIHAHISSEAEVRNK